MKKEVELNKKIVCNYAQSKKDAIGAIRPPYDIIKDDGFFQNPSLRMPIEMNVLCWDGKDFGIKPAIIKYTL